MGRMRHGFSTKMADKKRPKITLGGKERLDWARERWGEDPGISVQGRNGMVERMKEIFGVVPRSEELHRIRREVLAERSEDAKGLPPPVDLCRECKCEPCSCGTGAVYPEPGSTRSIEDRAIRIRYARHVIDTTNLVIPQVQKAVREKFGLGLDHYSINEYYLAARGKKAPARRKRLTPDPKPGVFAKPRVALRSVGSHQPSLPLERSPSPLDNKSKQSASDEAAKKIVAQISSGGTADTISVALRMLLDDIPGLVELTYRRGEGVEYKVEQVTTGKVTL